MRGTAVRYLETVVSIGHFALFSLFLSRAFIKYILSARVRAKSPYMPTDIRRGELSYNPQRKTQSGNV